MWNAPLGWSLWIFQGITVTLIALFGLYAWRSLRAGPPDIGAITFWTCIVLVLLLPGAYLEYPSDTWEHFRRIFSFTRARSIGEGEMPLKSFYFLAWTWVEWVPIESRRLALAFVAALTQLVVLKQVYELSRALGLSARWSKLHVAAFLAIFGSTAFGIRYYALASTAVALAASFRWITLSVRENRFCPRPLDALCLGLIMGLNHRQELVFAALSSTTLLLRQHYPALSRLQRRLFWGTVAALSVACVVAFETNSWPYSKEALQNAFSPWAGFRTSQVEKYLLDTTGMAGLLGTLFAIYWRKEIPTILMLTLAPVACLVLPFIVFLMAAGMAHIYDGYRILYAFPASLAFVTGAGLFLRKYWGKDREPSSENLKTEIPLPENFAAIAIVAFATVLLTLYPERPFRGRFLFLFHRPEALHALQPLDVTAKWFQDNPVIDFANHEGCRLYSDSATNFFLAAQLGYSDRFERLSPDRWGRSLIEPEVILNFIRQRNDMCGILVAYHDRIPVVPRSWGSTYSRHWPWQNGDLSALSSQAFDISANVLDKMGWRRLEVPPFYRLYLPPKP